MLKELEARLPHMTRAEQKVARVVLASPYDSVRIPLSLLAKQAQVSEPTVIRFCRSMNCRGFQDFKLQLAQDMATGAHFAETPLSPEDSTPDLVNKVFDSAISSLIKARDALPAQATRQAIELLASAERIEFYGLGGSGIVAQDAQHKFFRLGVPVIGIGISVRRRRRHCSHLSGRLYPGYYFQRRTGVGSWRQRHRDHRRGITPGQDGNSMPADECARRRRFLCTD